MKTKRLDVPLNTGRKNLYLLWLHQGVKTFNTLLILFSPSAENSSKRLTVTMQTHFEASFSKQEMKQI